MAFRPDIVAGRAVILLNIEDTIDKQLRTIRMKLRRFSNSLGEIGGELFRFGTVGTIGAIFPVKQFIDFQDQLLFTQTKLQVTDAEMKRLEGTIRELGKSTSFTSTDVGKAAQKLAQAGFTMQEVTNSLQAALDLSRAGQVDISTATDILANSIRTFGLETTEADTVASKFITAARLGTLDIVDLNEAIKNSATTFRLLGLDLSTSLALITRLSTASLRGTIAGTSLNRAFQKLAIENEKLAKQNIFLSEEDLTNPLQILTKIEEVTKSLSKTEAVGFLNDLLGIRGGRGVGGILIQGLGPLDTMIQQITGSFDEARVAAKKLDSRLGGSFRITLSALQELFLSISETSEGPLTKIFTALQGAFNDLSLLSQENPRLAQTLLALPPITLAAGAAFLTMAFAVNKLASAMTPLVSLNSMLFSTLFRGIRAPGEFIRTLTQGMNIGKAGKGLGFLSGISTSNRNFLKYLVSVRRMIKGILTDSMRFGGSPFRVQKNTFGGFGFRGPGKAPALDLKGGDIILTGRVVRGGRSGPELLGGPSSRGGSPLLGGRGQALLGGPAAKRSFGILNGLKRLFSLLRVGLLKELGEDLTNIVKIGRRLGSGIGSLFRVDYIRKLLQGFTMMGRALRGVFFVLNNIRRAVFSLSGILTIIELLIIIGPKVRPIREFFNAIGDFFKDVAGIKDSLAPALKTFSLGFQQIFSGKLTKGMETLKVALGDIITIVKLGLVDAWEKFYIKVSPILDRVRAIFNGILETIKAIIQSIGIIGGGAINSLLPEGGEGSLPGVDSINKFFSGAVEFIKGFAIQFVKMMDVVVKGLDKIITILYMIYNLVAGAFTDSKGLGLPAPLRLGAAGIIAELGKIEFPPFEPTKRDSEKTGEALGEAVGKAGKNHMDRVLEAEFGHIPGPQPEPKKVETEADIQRKLSEIFKPDVKLTRNQQTMVAARLDQLRNERNALNLVTKETKELERTAKRLALASEGGSFAKTRGNLLKSFEYNLDKERNNLLKEGNMKMDEMNGKLDENAVFQ